MKVAQLIGSVSRLSGGVLASVQGLSKALDALPDTEVTVVGVRDRHAAADRGGWAPVEVQLVPPPRRQFFRHVRGIRSTLERGNFDVVHTHLLWTYFSLADRRWSRATGRPYMVSPEGMLDTWALNHSRAKKRLALALFEGAHLRHAACLHALNDAEARAIRALGLSNPLCVIPNGVDPPPAGAPPPRPAWMSSERSATARNVLLYLGRIHAKKGLETLLRAWSQVVATRPSLAGNWTLAIAGWGSDRDVGALARLATELALDDAVRFTGPLYGEYKHAAFSHASAFVLPSFSEGLPISVLEAWAYGLPVFMTEACNIPEGFEAGAAMRITTSADAMAAELSSGLDTNGDNLAAIGARGRALVAARFTWPQAAADMRSVYEWLLGGGDPPSCVILE